MSKNIFKGSFSAGKMKVGLAEEKSQGYFWKGAYLGNFKPCKSSTNGGDTLKKPSLVIFYKRWLSILSSFFLFYTFYNVV